MRKDEAAVERLLGWLSAAVGASAFARNDSIIYRVFDGTGAIVLWTGLFLILGVCTVIASYCYRRRVRLFFAASLLFIWGFLFALISTTGAMGAGGWASVVIIVYLCGIVVDLMSVRDDGSR
jgi:hypothetical protein